MTVAKYAERWLVQRCELGLKSVKHDRDRLGKHVLPVIGSMELSEVRPSHARALVLRLRAAGLVAPRTLRNISSVASALFRDAVADEEIPYTPWVLPSRTLPKSVDKDPHWRGTAIFSREEVEILISDERIPPDRRVMYAFHGLAALRHAEAATLQWRWYDPEAQPLGRLDLGQTKTDIPRQVPVHPTLAAILAEWKLTHWTRIYGRFPTDDDLIVPTRGFKVRNASDACHLRKDDLERVGLRRRRGHDLRRTFIGMCRAAGARDPVLRAVTHGPRDILDVYSTFLWPDLCDEVLRLKVARRRVPIQLSLPWAAGTGAPSTAPEKLLTA